jgi:pimeloyl-ACP methyl ester carboxylesterase
MGAAAKECADGYEQAGVDLSGYTMPQVIEDFEAARKGLGYGRINLFSESYGTRVAQMYVYMYPESLRRVIQIGVNTPGHFLYDRDTFDEMIGHLAELCAQDDYCSSRTDDFAKTMYDVNRSMPERWLIFDIDPDTVRVGTHFMMMDNANFATVFDAYLAAGEGDYSALALLNLMVKVMYPADALFTETRSTRPGQQTWTGTAAPRASTWGTPSWARRTRSSSGPAPRYGRSS